MRTSETSASSYYSGGRGAVGVTRKLGRHPTQGLRVRDVDMLVPNLHDPRLLQLTQSPSYRLPVRPYQASELLVGVASGYPAAALAGDESLRWFAEPEDQTCQSGRHFLTD